MLFISASDKIIYYSTSLLYLLTQILIEIIAYDINEPKIYVLVTKIPSYIILTRISIKLEFKQQKHSFIRRSEELIYVFYIRLRSIYILNERSSL